MRNETVGGWLVADAFRLGGVGLILCIFFASVLDTLSLLS